jgi:hypothetical protein
MGKNRRDRMKAQSAVLNGATYERYMADLIRIAISRFQWHGLPDTVNKKFLEHILLKNGLATIAHPKDKPDVWYGLPVSTTGKLNAYGEPVEWVALGMDGSVQFEVTPENGVLVYNSNMLVGSAGAYQDPTWLGLDLYARKLTHYDRTEDVNLILQASSIVFKCPAHKRMEVINMYKQTAGFEPMVVTTNSELNDIETEVLNAGVPFICEELNAGKRNIWNAAYGFLGIPHLSYEKSERMITSEAESNEAPTTLRLMDALAPRRLACEQLRDKFGINAQCVFNNDLEGKNYLTENSIETEGDESEGAENGE